MNRPLDARWKAGLASALLFLLGAVAGVAGDRLWLGSVSREAAATPLTPQAMAAALGLDATDDARVRSVLDSLQVDVARAAQAGPDSLRSVARRGRQRLEEALPPDRRVRFQEWMQEHHARMMRMMGPSMMQRSDSAGGGMMGPGTMGPDSARGMMGPGMMGTDSVRGGMMGPGMMGPDTAGGPA